MPFYELVCIAAHNRDYVRGQRTTHNNWASSLTMCAEAYQGACQAVRVTCHGWRRRCAGIPVLGTEDIAANGAQTEGYSYTRRVRAFLCLNPAHDWHWPDAELYSSFWTMHFDASPENQRGLFRLLKKDPAVVRTSMLKMGENLRGVSSGPERTIMSAAGLPTLMGKKQQL